MTFHFLQPLLKSSNSKIILLVLDGLGGLPIEPGGPTELEAAHTPHMDMLAQEGELGQIIPIRPGITPGSGPSHLALFGYDPLKYEIGRGVLEAAGVGLIVERGDVAARGNFVTLDVSGNISDRRAGRIASAEAAPLIERLSTIAIPQVQIDIRQVREYRFAMVLRGEGLSPDVNETDPQQTGVPPLKVQSRSLAADHTATILNHWINEAHLLLADHPKANGLTLRGFATDPNLPNFNAVYGIKAACISVYPMYRGVAHLVGMDMINFTGEEPEDEFRALEKAWIDYDFFFIHIKKTDSRGEDGDFVGKVKVIEGVDKALPLLLKLKPDVLIITGDHSTPAKMMTHTWHPVPFLLWAPKTVRPDNQSKFGERFCALGGLGTFSALNTMPLVLAHANRLEKYGA